MYIPLRRMLRSALLIASLWGSAACAQSPVATPPPAALGSGDDQFYEALKAKLRDDDRQAITLFEAYVAQFPNNGAAYYNLSQLQLKANNPERAERDIRKAVAIDGNNKFYREQLGFVLTSRGSFAEAADLFVQLADRERFNENYLIRAARLYQRAGKNRESLAVIDRLIRQNGPEEDLLIQKQQLFLGMNQLDSAVRTVQQLIDRNPRESKYYSLLGEIYENNNQLDKAATVYEQAEKRFPNDPLIQLSLATYYKKRKDEAKYQEYVRKAIVNRQLDAATQISILLPYLQDMASDSNQRNTVNDLASQLVKQHPRDPQITAFYAEVLAISGETNKAAEAFKTSLELDPSRFNVWQQLLYLYTDRANADSLIVYSGKAIRLFPNQAMAHYLNGVGYLNRNQYRQAAAAINRAIDLQPEENGPLTAEMHATLGDVYNQLKDYPNSDKSYEAALRINPTSATALNNYAYYLSERGVRLDEAEKMSKRSLELRPEESTFLDTYGWILYKQGKYDKARTYIEKAVKARGTEADGTLLDHLGDVYARIGDANKALEYWKAAKQKGADNPQLDKKIAERKLYE